MKLVLILVLVLLFCLGFAGTTDLSSSSDKQLGALLTNNWYELLPHKIRS